MSLIYSMALSTTSCFGSPEWEESESFYERKVKGDASEAGLLRFLTPVLMREYGGDVVVREDFDNALDQVRVTYPIHKDENG